MNAVVIMMEIVGMSKVALVTLEACGGVGGAGLEAESSESVVGRTCIDQNRWMVMTGSWDCEGRTGRGDGETERRMKGTRE